MPKTSREGAESLAPLEFDQRLYRADCDTAFAIFARLGHGRRPSFLLESAEGGEQWGRYSMMGIGRQLEVIGRADGTVVRRPAGGEIALGAGLGALRTVLSRTRPAGLDTPERFGGGLVGYVAYDAVRDFERVPEGHADPSSPRFRFVVPDVLGVYDSFQQTLRVIAFAASGRGASTEIGERLERIDGCLRSDETFGLTRFDGYPLPEPAPGASLACNVTPEAFMASVERAKEYILAGDVFQVVLSLQLRASGVRLDPLSIYRRLRLQNPSPYLFLLAFDDETLIGASPEVMVRLTGRRAEVRPIAGTRPRGRTPSDDAALEAELLADPKEIAEHVMLLDLGRNDLGRVCEIGSIAIPERLVVERYSRVMHIVSHVEGRLREGLDWLDLFGATFPAGTLSGAPKIRAMEIIDELETARRNHYGGAVGYIGFDGNMDTCITIRTLHERDGEYLVQAGAGLVADSVPAREYEECLNKARALLRAAGVNPPEEAVAQ